MQRKTTWADVVRRVDSSSYWIERWTRQCQERAWQVESPRLADDMEGNELGSPHALFLTGSQSWSAVSLADGQPGSSYRGRSRFGVSYADRDGCLCEDGSNRHIETFLCDERGPRQRAFVAAAPWHLPTPSTDRKFGLSWVGDLLAFGAGWVVTARNLSGPQYQRTLSIIKLAC